MPIAIEFKNEIIKKWKDALAKQYYYGNRLKDLRKINRGLEFGIAFFTGGTLLSMLPYFHISTLGQDVITGVFGVIAFILSLVKAIGNPNYYVERYEKLYSVWEFIASKYNELNDEVNSTRRVDEKNIREKFGNIARLKDSNFKDVKDDTDIDQKIIIDHIQNRVKIYFEGKTILEYIPFNERQSQKEFKPVPIVQVEGDKSNHASIEINSDSDVKVDS